MNINVPFIEKYSFGTIVIDGKVYHRDVIIYPEGVYYPWWRNEGHRLSLEDLNPVKGTKLEMLIIGTGAFGRMKVPLDVREELNKNIPVIEVLKTGNAFNLYNQNRMKKRVAAALHLTC